MGPDNLAAILNATDSELEKEMLDALTSVDEELSDDVKEKMFIFDNLMQLDNMGFQRLVREVAQENLLIALKGVDEVLAERFFDNMSERAAEILREDMEASGPVKLADVEAAQKEIVRMAKKLADDGELMIGKAARTMSDVGSDLASLERWQPRAITTVPTSHKVLRKSLNRRGQKGYSEGLAQGQAEARNKTKNRQRTGGFMGVHEKPISDKDMR